MSGRILQVAVFVLCFFSLASGAFAQAEDQPAPGSTQQKPQPAPAPAGPFFGVNCTGTAMGLDCRAVQMVQITKTHQAAVAVRVPPDTKKPVMLILFPLGINLPSGVTLQFGQDEAKTVPVQNCDSTGCLALYAITDAEITAMIKGQSVTISVRPQGGQPISFKVPLGGFPAAYAKIK